MSLRNSKAKGVHDLQLQPIKYVIDIIAPCLAYTYNLVLESGHFPQSVKIAKVSVIFKNGERNDANNYRPIPILPIFSKGLEKVIFSRINNFFLNHNIITNCQHGFQRGKSTEMALLAQKEFIIKNIEDRKLTLGIFIDCSKAFDNLSHSILLTKLQSYGVRGIALSLLQSYLSERKQYVEVGVYFFPKNSTSWRASRKRIRAATF